MPEIDPVYRFNPDVTLAILAGFTRDRRVMVQGLHGTGKSTHIEQVAARLNWPCVRVNLDGHISRLDLVGKDAVVLRDGQQVTEFQEGIVPWALQRPVALIFDEYDAGRPDVMFVIQRILERDGKFTLMDQNRVHPPASVLPPVRHRQHRRPGQPERPVPRRAAAQPRADRPLEHRRVAELPAARRRDRDRAGARARARRRGRPRARRSDGRGGRPDAQGLRRRRPVDADVAAHRDHLGREHRDLPRPGAGVPAVVRQQVRRSRAAARGRVLPALLRPRARASRTQLRREPQRIAR